MTDKGRQGFASMDKDIQRKIASAGGTAAHAVGTAHEWNRDSAREAGRKGGTESGRRRKLAREALAAVTD